jgi:hypothetical protein
MPSSKWSSNPPCANTSIHRVCVTLRNSLELSRAERSGEGDRGSRPRYRGPPMGSCCNSRNHPYNAFPAVCHKTNPFKTVKRSVQSASVHKTPFFAPVGSSASTRQKRWRDWKVSPDRTLNHSGAPIPPRCVHGSFLCRIVQKFSSFEVDDDVRCSRRRPPSRVVLFCSPHLLCLNRHHRVLVP